MNNALERDILRGFYESVTAVKSLDNTISDFKIVRDTQNKLKDTLRSAVAKCTCSKRSYGICEVCEASDRELVFLRNFFRVIRNAKKRDMTAIEIREFVENISKDLK